MMRPFQKAIVLALILLSALLECAAGAGPEPASWEDYTVVVTKNIFLRNRGSSSRRAEDAAREAPPAPPPEHYMMVRGTVQQGQEFLAFLEDIRTGTTSVLRVGEAVATGRLTAITLDNVEYESNGVAKTVMIGQNLEAQAASPLGMGELSEVVGSSQVPLSGTAGGKPASQEDTAVMERLRQRRQEEAGR